jgi:hypothetical protein
MVCCLLTLPVASSCPPAGTIKLLEDSRTYCNTDVRLDGSRSEGNYGMHYTQGTYTACQ